MKPEKIPHVNKETILNFLREHKGFLEEKFGITKIALFGSYAREDQTKESDIDLLIEAKEHDFDNRYDFKEFLEEVFNRKVDVCYFDSVRKFIMHRIQEELAYA